MKTSKLNDMAILVDEAYAAAFDCTLWTPWLDRIVDATGASGAAFHVIDQSAPASSPSWFSRIDPAAIEAYVRDPRSAFDPQIAYSFRQNRSCVYRDTDYVDLGAARTAEYVGWLEASTGWRHHLTACSVLNGGKTRAGVSIHFDSARGPAQDSTVRQLSAMLPSFSAALSLAFRHSEALTDGFWNGLTAHNDGRAMALLDNRGRVSRLTGTLRALADRDDGLSIVQNRLHATRPADAQMLAAKISAAIVPDMPRPGATQIARRSGRASYIVTVLPLPRRQRHFAPLGAAALLSVIDPAMQPPTHAALFREAFGFTPREAEVAVLLMAGHSAESAAEALRLRLPTARLHLRALFAKTGTGRQTDLIRLLARIS